MSNLASKKNVEDQPESNTIPYREYMLRVLFTSFYPAVKLGLDLNYPLDTIKDMMTLALWKEAKAKHSTINLISLIFGKSTRTLKSLSARYNRGRFFEQSETNLCRQIEDLLHQRPMTAEELSDRLPHYNEFDGTMLAIKMLLRSGRITEEIHEGRLCYIPIDRHHNLYSQDWEVRIDALSEHLEAISETLRLRFLEENPSELSAARTFTFKANSEDIEEFREEVFEFIRRKYRKLEDKANLVELDNKSHNVNNESSQSTAHSNLDSISPKSDKKLDIKTFSLYLGVTPIPHKESKS
jgi:hypothetical protein